MRPIEETDPYLIAADELVDDLAMQRAEREGRVEQLAAGGMYVVNEDGELDFVGPAADVLAAYGELVKEAYENDLLDLDDDAGDFYNDEY